MGLTKLDWLLAAGTAITLSASLFVGHDHAQPNFEFLPDMARAAHFGAFEPNPNFADGKTQQAPQPGTIARGLLPLHYAATPEDALRAGRELTSPYAGASADVLRPAIERGGAAYRAWCVACHGGGGTGDGPVALRGFPPPPSLLAPHARDMADGQLFHVITYGQGNMPAHASLVDRDDRWKVVAYLRKLQESADGE